MQTNHLFRGFSLAAMLMAGSCAVPVTNGPSSPMPDGAVNHPITVEPSYQSLKLAYSAADSGLSSADQARFASFVAAYLEHGNGAIAVSAPSGLNSSAMISFFAQRINDMGVSKDHILVSTHDAPDSDQRVEINYVSYEAHTQKCGDWSDDLAYTADNLTPKNFGCAVQQNIAAQVADPRDLMQPRPMQDASAVRRDTVVTTYEQGKITAADKHKADLKNEQSGTSSDVTTQ
jgi:pilus assembly protein CpaD